MFPVKFSLSAEVLNPLSHVVCYTAVFSVVTQRNATQRNDTKNGCAADYSPTQMLSGLYHVFVGEEQVTKA